MLTKIELNKKKAKSSEQLDLVETISADDSSKKKRQLLFISLFVTIGLSFIFWSYRQVSTLLKSPLPTISLPSFTLPSDSSLDSEITNLISSNENRWNVSVYNEDIINWSKNSHNPDHQTILKSLLTTKNNSSFAKNYLPQGLVINEDYQESPSKIVLNTLVTTPQKKLLFMITIEGNHVIQSKELLSKLITSLYWAAIKD